MHLAVGIEIVREYPVEVIVAAQCFCIRKSRAFSGHADIPVFLVLLSIDEVAVSAFGRTPGELDLILSCGNSRKTGDHQILLRSDRSRRIEIRSREFQDTVERIVINRARVEFVICIGVSDLDAVSNGGKVGSVLICGADGFGFRISSHKIVVGGAGTVFAVTPGGIDEVVLPVAHVHDIPHMPAAGSG